MKFRRIKESISLRAVVAAGVSALLTLTILTSIATPASAYVLSGVRYDPNSINPIEYKFYSVDLLYILAFRNAEAVWDATSAPGYFSEKSLSLDPEIEVRNADFGTGFWAITEGTDTNRDRLWDGNEVRIYFNSNANEMGSLTAYQKMVVAEHELGHAYGHAENNNQGCVLMRQGWDKFTCGTMPTADDIAGVDAIY
ncbi:MAG: hypothetical protein WC562_00715 [Dehalococcoidia bacterium]